MTLGSVGSQGVDVPFVVVGRPLLVGVGRMLVHGGAIVHLLRRLGIALRARCLEHPQVGFQRLEIRNSHQRLILFLRMLLVLGRTRDTSIELVEWRYRIADHLIIERVYCTRPLGWLVHAVLLRASHVSVLLGNDVLKYVGALVLRAARLRLPSDAHGRSFLPHQ